MSMKWYGTKSLDALSGQCVGWCLSSEPREHIEHLGWAHYVDSGGRCYWKRTRRSDRVYRPFSNGGSVLTLARSPLATMGWRSVWIYKEGDWYEAGDPYLYPHRQPGDQPSTAEKRFSYICRAFPTWEARVWAVKEVNAARPGERYHLFRKWWRGNMEGYPDRFPLPVLLTAPDARLVDGKPSVYY